MVLAAKVFSPALGSPVLYVIKKQTHLTIKTMKTQMINPLIVVARITIFSILVLVAACSGKEGSTANDSTATASKPEVKPPQIDIHTAVISGNIDALKQHIAAGSNLNEKDPFGGSSPLISACVFGKPDAAKLLIDAGAELDFQNNDEATALHTAAFFCRPEIVKMLLEKNANKTVKNKYGATPYEGVAGPYSDVKPVYEMMEKVLGPMGLKLDFEYIQKTRPVIAEMLK